jgi:glycosyltransferase involved in cell wall biosynthesis
MSAPDTPTISVITTTYNAAEKLPTLIESLRRQTDRKFRWIVADGASTDQTLELLRKTAGLDILVTSEPDFGIYDGINRALRSCTTDYYLVAGADDSLSDNAIEEYRAAAARGGLPDIVAAAVLYGGRLIPPRSRMGWYAGMPGISSSHSVGMLIKTSLHARFGFYSKHFPIAADQLFVKTALGAGASIKREAFLAGEFSLGGVTGSDYLGVLTEVFRVQVRTERWVFLQYALFIARCARHYLRQALRNRSRCAASAAKNGHEDHATVSKAIYQAVDDRVTRDAADQNAGNPIMDRQHDLQRN